MFLRTLILKTSALPPVERMVRNSGLFRSLVSRFIAGDTLDEAMHVAEGLLTRGLRVSLDYLGENTSTESEACHAVDTYARMLCRIDEAPAVQEWRAQHGRLLPSTDNNKFIPEPINISIKLTQCGLDLGETIAEQNLRSILELAQSKQNFVRCDMEASMYTEKTLSIIERVFPSHPNTGTVLQSCLFRTDDDLQRLLALGCRIRLVKGAYLEPPNIAYPDKAKVDDAFVRQAQRMLMEGVYPAIATQDATIIEKLNSFVRDRGISKASFEYQMLYGVRTDLQESLADEGYNVRVYVPFGDSWYPYFTRRLAERPANTLFILRAILRG